MHAVAHLRDLAEEDGRAARNQHIRRVARGGVGRHAGEGVAAAALQADEQVGQGQLLAAALVEHGHLLLRHGHDRADVRLKALVVLQDDDVLRGVVLRAHEHVHRQLFAAEGHDHQLPAEVRVMAEVAQRADGHLGLRRVDGDAAAVGMVDGDDVVHVRILGQDLPADALHGDVQHALHALHGGLDAQDVAGAGEAALGVAVAEPGCNRRLGQVGTDVHAVGHVVKARRRRQAQHVLVDPLSLGDGVKRIAQLHAVADDRAVLRDIREGDLVPLRDVAQGDDAGHDLGALLNLLDGDGDIVLFGDLDIGTHHRSPLTNGLPGCGHPDSLRSLI